jgi:predicted ester cyclase
MEPKSVVTLYAEQGLNGELVSDVRLRQRDGFLRAAFPDLEFRPRLLVAEGALVAGHFAARGTHLGLFQGVPATGRRWGTACTAVFRVAEGRIAEAWVTWDQLALLEQLGAVERVATVSA